MLVTATTKKNKEDHLKIGRNELASSQKNRYWEVIIDLLEGRNQEEIQLTRVGGEISDGLHASGKILAG